VTIFLGSRYQSSAVAAVKTDRGWRPTVLRELPAPAAAFSEIVTTSQTSLQELADRVYGEAEFWWHIADANPDILYPDRIPPGTTLRVPNASTLR
jgi:nucleoid-associated protein YgaU